MTLAIPPHASATGVLVVGSINVDLVVSTETLPVEGETVTGGEFRMSGGGKGANQAAAAARAGAIVKIIGAVGGDDNGEMALAGLRATGVDTQDVAKTGVPTGVALIVVDRHGNNQIAVASGANAALDPESVGLLVAGQVDPPGCLLLSNEVAEAVNLAAVRAVPAGTHLVLDPAPARAIAPELLAASPILTPNRMELAAMGGSDDVNRAACSLHRQTRAPVLVTLGPKGVLLVSDMGEVELAAPPVGTVDTTGAGDTFAGTLAARLAEGKPLEQAAREAVSRAADSVTRDGTGWSLGRQPS